MTDQTVREEVLIVVYIFSMVLIVGGNVLVIMAISLNPPLRTSSNLFILSLSVADLIIGVFVVPSSLAQHLDPEHFTGSYPCILVPWIQLLSVSASVFSLLGIGIERYRAIAQPAKPKFTTRQVHNIIAAVWGVAVVYAFRSVVYLQLVSIEQNDGDHYEDNDDNHTKPSITADYTMITVMTKLEEEDSVVCNFLNDETESDVLFRIADFFLLFFIPIMILVWMYTVMIYQLWWRKMTHSTEGLNKRRKAIKVFLTVVIMFIISWAPFHLIEIIRDLQEMAQSSDVEEDGEPLAELRLASIVLALCNSWMNPIIYAALNKNFRREMKRVLLKCKDKRQVTPSDERTT